MKLIQFIEKNKKAIYASLFCIFMISIIFIWLLYSKTLANINTPWSKNISFSTLKLDENAYGQTEFDAGRINLKPILDKDIETKLDNVIYIDFRVGGNKENDAIEPIYDISLVDLKIDCDLLNPYLKWKLLKNGEELSHGNLDYHFDTIKNGRLVLTPIQEDLKDYNEDKSQYDYYQFYLWISDSCQEEDITKCIGYETQEQLTNKQISGKIEVELYTQTKVELIRTPSEELDTTTCITAISDIATDNETDNIDKIDEQNEEVESKVEN